MERKLDDVAYRLPHTIQLPYVHPLLPSPRECSGTGGALNPPERQLLLW